MNSNLKIRICENRDKEEYIRLNLQFMKEVMDENPYWNSLKFPTKEEMEKVFTEALSADKNIIIFVAEIDGKIAGYINSWNCYSIWSMGQTLMIDDLYVDTNMRRKKIGIKLMEFVIKYSKDNGYNRVQLHAESDNYSAHNLYKKLGFEQEEMKFFMKKLEEN